MLTHIYPQTQHATMPARLGVGGVVGLVALVLCAGLVSALGESIIRSRYFSLFFWEALCVTRRGASSDAFSCGQGSVAEGRTVTFHGAFLFLEDGFLC
ncbi:hypothetical protein K438DRAFT_1865809 [Mycena galopus ATCC 62051]|nr:hypothetical protein K438DRAFT_1865809 [Mycena galopus ATCC 62051]